MFKFNFSNIQKDDTPEETSTAKTDCKCQTWLKSQQIVPINDNDVLRHILNHCEQNALDCCGLELKYFSTVDILNILRTSEDCEFTKTFSVLNADESHSDLNTAVYEGGLKIWECTYDLIDYITQNDLQLGSKRVLDLGCGVGLIGLLCLLKGALCTFQDYNIEILQYITIPNVKLNDEMLLQKSKFFSGDWHSFIECIDIKNEEEKFCYIFTSETIYNEDNYGKLHNVFEKLLKKDGKVFLAAKSYYFGVGGGISSFEQFLATKNVFTSVPCWKCEEGLKREILDITFR